MAPGLLNDEELPSRTAEHSYGKGSSYQTPLRPSGALDQFDFEETTPVIGREYFGIDIVNDLLNAPDADDRLRDVAIASKYNLPSPQHAIIDFLPQSPSAASSSSANKTTLQMIFKSSSSIA